MPVFNPLLAFGSLVTGVAVGETYNMVNAETVADGYVSMPITPLDQSYRNISFTANFATTPTATVILYGSNTYPNLAGPQNGVVISTFTNANGSIADNSGFEFYWIGVTAYSGGGALTVTLNIV